MCNFRDTSNLYHREPKSKLLLSSRDIDDLSVGEPKRKSAEKLVVSNVAHDESEYEDSFDDNKYHTIETFDCSIVPDYIQDS